MGTTETLANLRAFETGLAKYHAFLETCWKREWLLTVEMQAILATDRASLQRAYGGLRPVFATANGGAIPHFGYSNNDLGEMGQVALSDPRDDSSVMDALDSAQQMVAQAIGYFERIIRDEAVGPQPSVSPFSTARISGANARSGVAPRTPAASGRGVARPERARARNPWMVPGRYYARLLQQALGMLWDRSNFIADAISVAVLFALLFNEEIATAIGALHWGGLPKAMAVLPIVVLVAYDLLVANHRNLRLLLDGSSETEQERDAARADVARLEGALAARRRDIAFAHRLNEKYEDGVHRILNHPFQSEKAIALFKQMEEAWTQDVVNALNAHPCTPYEITRFKVLQEVPRDKHFHADPAWDDLKQQLNERLHRLRWLIERYGEKAPE